MKKAFATFQHKKQYNLAESKNILGESLYLKN